MEVTDIRDLILRADPAAKHYEHSGDGPYTTWAELRRLSHTEDDRHVRGWAFSVDHFTDIEYSETAAAIEEILDSDDRVAYSYEVIYEDETETIHHAFSCEGF